MCLLGEEYLIDKIIKRYERSEQMRKIGLCLHYINDVNGIKNRYYTSLKNCKEL